jgi:hypothetical protein
MFMFSPMGKNPFLFAAQPMTATPERINWTKQPVTYSIPNPWLIIVRRSVSERSSIMPDRIIARIVKCWPRLRFLAGKREDDARFAVIADDTYSWFICFTGKVSPKYGDKFCAYVTDVRPSRPSDFDHLPAGLRPAVNRRNQRLIARSAPTQRRPLPSPL